jgi:hypothetical protein
MPRAMGGDTAASDGAAAGGTIPWMLVTNV